MITNIIFRRSDSPITSDKPHYPYELPKGWAWCKLEDFINDATDFVASGSFASLRENVKYYDEPGYAILVRTKDFQNGFTKGLVYTDRHGYEFLANSNLFGGELILPNIGASIGKVFIVPHLDIRMTLAPNSIMIKCFKDIHKKWLQYLFLSPFGQEQLRIISSSTAQGKFNKTDLRALQIPIPPFDEQERIISEVEFLSHFIEMIEYGQDKLQETIKQAKSKILDLAIHGKLVPQDPTDEPASELLKRINPKAEITCDNGHYQKLPEGWCECTLGSLFLFIRNGINIHQDKSKIGYPITRIETISSEFIDRSRMGYAAITEENYSDYYLQKDDILMSHINSPIHVGKCALCDIKAGEKIIHGMNLLCLRPYPDIEAKFILMVFRSPYFKDEIRPFIKNAVNQASINIRNLSSVLLHLPPVSEQHRIVAKIEEIFAQLDAIEASL